MPSINKQFMLILYAVVGLYAATTYLGGALFIFLTIVGMGLPMFMWMGLAHGTAPALALLAGYQSRWSVPFSLLAGCPLVLAATWAFPYASSGSRGLGVVVPWLAIHDMPEARASVRDFVNEQLPWTAGAYLCAMLAGIGHRALIRRRETVAAADPTPVSADGDQGPE